MGNSIELYRNKSQLMNDAIDRLVVETHMYKQQMNYKTFLFSGCGSESGTTTLTINLAIALSMAGWKTVLVDCDLRKGTKYKKLTEDAKIGVTDYLTEKMDKSEVTYSTNYDLLDVIPSGKGAESPVRLLCSSKMELLMQELKEEYDYVIYDFPSINIVPDASTVFSSVDGIVLVAALNQTTKRQVSDARRKVKAFDLKYCGMVVNEVELQQYKKYRKDYDYFKLQNLEKKHAVQLKRQQKK